MGMMSSRTGNPLLMKSRFIIFVACGLIAEACTLLHWQDTAQTTKRPAPVRYEHVAYDPTRTQQTVSSWAMRARRDPEGAIEAPCWRAGICNAAAKRATSQTPAARNRLPTPSSLFARAIIRARRTRWP